MIYDHFLASDEKEFSEDSLYAFSMDVYASLDQFGAWLPGPFALMFPYMKQQNWLFNYRTRRGAARSMGGLVHRSAYLTESETGFRLFEQYYQPLEDCYRHFWNDVKPFARQRLESLLSGDKYL